MSTFKVDKEQINDSVETLKKLLEECEEAYNKEIPESTQDKGQTHDELNELCNTLKTTCYRLGELISKTIQFLGESSEMFEESDKTSATAIAADASNRAIQPRHTGYNHITFPTGTIGNVTASVSAKDASFFAEGIKDKASEYLDIINSDGDIQSKSSETISWLSSIRGDTSKIKDYVEYLCGDEFEWPSPIDTGFDFIKAIDTSNKLVFGLVDYGEGLVNGDVSTMTEGADGLLGAIKSGISTAVKTDNAMTNFKSGLLLDYGKNMVSNWIESIQTETKVSEVYWNTFANSAVEVFNDTVCNAPTLAIAYKPAEIISSAVGFDLQGAYEKVSDKKGFAAVTDTFSQMNDIFMENASWENWKSGMGIITDKISSLFK